MKRITLSLLCASLLATGACSTASDGEKTNNKTDSEVAGGNAGDNTMNAATKGDSVSSSAVTDSAGSAATASTGPGTLNGSTLDDKQFMVKADQGGHNEIGLSKLALEKGVTGNAKTYADKMIADHTKAGNELKPIAQKKGVTLTGDMDPDHKTMRDRMSKMSGKEFEQAYMGQMAKDHEETVALLQSEIDNGQDPDAKAWAQKTLPVVKQHTDMAHKNNGMRM
ncbi:DUF4142 domain-containing protein [Hymenobacter sp. GOD-10R]|uniref:DUF4142 domain-containing protein n=1 Tax=Hymenobacter sp. GOD-10R TaxID=3093922 RepID=UPI002D794EF2|nr:DUF4142 domain-containing protein [Hymenobacter sp. GOD-10R]WRQ28284.1 DUF4142 domain-containing protein [Hymenobacter sp. GOD-10R]